MERGVLRKRSFLWKRRSAPQNFPQSPSLAEFTSVLVPDKLWVLLVFPRDDFSCNALWLACEKLGHSFHVARTARDAAACFAGRRHHLVLVDCRFPELLDHRDVCREIRADPAGQHVVVVAVILRRDLDNEENPASREYLELGFSRYMVESSNVGFLINELVLLEKQDLVSVFQNSLKKIMSTAISISTDFVYITDKKYTIQFANASAEKTLGLSAGADLRSTCNLEESELMVQQLDEGCEWSGTLVCHELRGESVIHQTAVFPVGLPRRPTTHYMFVHKPVSVSGKEHNPRSARNCGQKPANLSKSAEMGNNPKPRKRSNNAEEKKLQLIQEETIVEFSEVSASSPRSQTISPRSQNNSNSPQLPPNTPRPNSPQLQNDDTMLRALVACCTNPSNNLEHLPAFTATYELQTSLPQMRQLLRTAMNWDFEIFQLEELSEHRPLVHLGMHLFRKFGAAAALGCDEATLQNWLSLLDSHYHRDNPYHNSTHAADVMQSTAYFMATDRLSRLLDPLDRAACLISAAAHDVDHPGKNATFLCNSGHPLAYLYNDTSVLEMHHASFAFHLTLSDASVNIMKGLTNEQYQALRQCVIEMILATEMSKHFEILQHFDDTVFWAESYVIGHVEKAEATAVNSAKTVSDIRRMMLKCADVSNPTRPVHICAEWALRITEEYFAQTDEEKARNLPVTMPLFERETSLIPESQIGFMNFVIEDLFETWEGFVHLPELLVRLEKNFNFWKYLQEKDIRTREDIKSYLESHLDLT